MKRKQTIHQEPKLRGVPASCLIGFLMLFAINNNAFAQEPVVYEFTTDVPGFTTGCPACLFEGHPVTGSFAYDSDVGLPTITPTGFSVYLGGISAWSGSVGSNSFSDDLGLALVGNDRVQGSRDILRFSPGLFLEGFETGGFTLIDVRMLWLQGAPGDPLGNPDFLTDQNLPTEFPDFPGLLLLDFENPQYPGILFTVSFQNLIVTRAPTNVTVDIKNSINLKSNGNIPVIVFSTDTFDATQLDIETVAFGPNAATESHGRAHVEDVDADGDADLVLHFNTQDTGIQCSDAEATLTGAIYSGESVTGTDAITVVKCQ
jgi:hypothetical protein